MDVFVGFISPFPFDWAPVNWSLCNGATMSLQQYTALYSLIGTKYGGDGRSTFGLPDLRGRQIIGMGQQPNGGGSNFPIASHGGSESTVLTAAQTPLVAHAHTATFTPGGGSGSQASLSVSTAAASSATPVLSNGQTAYLANAAAGSSSNALKGLYTTTAPAEGATATIPVNGGGGGSGGTVSVGPAGQAAAAAVPLMNPFLALNFCIALVGFYPARN
jgi:microcystin-dependent protein